MIFTIVENVDAAFVATMTRSGALNSAPSPIVAFRMAVGTNCHVELFMLVIWPNYARHFHAMCVRETGRPYRGHDYVRRGMVVAQVRLACRCILFAHI